MNHISSSSENSARCSRFHLAFYQEKLKVSESNKRDEFILRGNMKVIISSNWEKNPHILIEIGKCTMNTVCSACWVKADTGGAR